MTTISQITNDRQSALIRIDPGFHFRPPPDPHLLNTFITPDTTLFQTIHMGAAIIDHSLWRLSIHGLVSHPFSLNLSTFPESPCRSPARAFSRYSASAPCTYTIMRFGRSSSSSSFSPSPFLFLFLFRSARPSAPSSSSLLSAPSETGVPPGPFASSSSSAKHHSKRRFGGLSQDSLIRGVAGGAADSAQVSFGVSHPNCSNGCRSGPQCRRFSSELSKRSWGGCRGQRWPTAV